MHQSYSAAWPAVFRLLPVAFVFSALCLAQNASIHGLISDRYGVGVGQAPVLVSNTGTGATRTAIASEGGSFTLSGLPPGTYQISVDWIGYLKFSRENVVLKGNLLFDIRLQDAEVANTPGELIFRHLVGAPIKGQVPRTAAGKPDLSGVWLPAPELDPEKPEILPAAAAIMKQRQANGTLSPRALCLPSGIVRITELDLIKLVQTPKLLVMLDEGGDPGYRQIFLDGRPHPRDPFPTWQGHSVGRWEGDTLVVDTVGLNDKVWLALFGPFSGLPQSEQAHIVERFDRLNFGQLRIEYTINDPGTLARPWKIRRILTLAPNEEVQEYLCTENNTDPRHMQMKQ